MKKLLGVLVAGILLTQVDGASAQQKWTIPGPQNTHAHQQGHAQVHFPISAAIYEVHISRALEKLRAARPIGPITQGDLNHTILILRECASRVEADGVVTVAEMNSCNHAVYAYKQGRLIEVMATTDSSDWQRWSGQTQHSTHHQNGGH